MGFTDRRLTFVGAGAPGDGGAGAAVVDAARRVLRPFLEEEELERVSSFAENLEAVRSGVAQLGALPSEVLVQDLAGSASVAGYDLRVVANINQPRWLVIALRGEGGDLEALLARGGPLRVRRGPSPLVDVVLQHYGIDGEALASSGGSLLSVHDGSLGDWAGRGEFDLIIDVAYPGFSREVAHLARASMSGALELLPVPDEVARNAARRMLGEWSVMPANVLYGQVDPVPSVSPPPIALYGLESMPEGFTRLVAQALDENRAMLRSGQFALSFDSLNVAMSYGVPLHNGSRRYFRAMNYPVGNAEDDHDHDENEDHSHGPGDAAGHAHMSALPPVDGWNRVGKRGPNGMVLALYGEYSGRVREGGSGSLRVSASRTAALATPASVAPAPAEPAWQGGFGRR